MQINSNNQHTLYELTKAVEKLQSEVMEWYNATIELYENTTTVTRSYTNVPNGKNSGFLIDTYGHLYKIVGGDDTTLLVEYYSLLGQYTLVEGGGGSSAQQIYYHNIHYYHPDPAGNGSYDISCNFILPSVESTPFTYNDMIDCIKYYLAPAWDPESSILPDKTIVASGYSSGFDADDNRIVFPAECIVLEKVGANTVVECAIGGSRPVALNNATFTDYDDENNEIEINCVTDTVLSGLYSFPRPI